MQLTIKTLPMTEQMYDYIFQHWRSNEKVFNNRFIYVTSIKEWNYLQEDDSHLVPNKSYVYVKDDMTSILSRPMIFGDCPTPDYGRKLGQYYYYVFTFRASDNVTVDSTVERTINGSLAWRKFYSVLRKKYTMDEIDERINLFSTKDENTKEILHSTPFMAGKGHQVYESNKVHKVTNVKYYDINKAYASNLIKMFPRLKDWILKQYKVDKPYFKKVLNYTVGMMNHFYNSNPNSKLAQWHYLRNTIVTNTTNQMLKAMSEINSEDSFVFYINTDGFMIANPSKELEHSDAIGDFGEEVVDNGEVWFTKVVRSDSTKYSIMQWFEDGEIQTKSLGGFLQEAKLISHIDLSKNKVVSFTTTNIDLGLDDNGKRKTKRIVNIDSIKEIENYGR